MLSKFQSATTRYKNFRESRLLDSFNKKTDNGGEIILENSSEEADQASLKLSEIENQFRDLTNKFEEINFKLDKLSNRLTKLQSDNQFDLSKQKNY